MGLFDFSFGFSKSKTNVQGGLSLEDQKKLAKYMNSLSLDKASQQAMSKQYEYENKLLSTSSQATRALNQSLMKYQYQLERQSRQTSFVDTKKDLMSAGYNPLLAVGNQSNYVPVSSNVQGTSQGVEDSQLGVNRAQMAETASNIINTSSATQSQVKRNAIMNDNDTQSTIGQWMKTLAEVGNINSATTGQSIQNQIQNLYGEKTALANLHNILENTNLSRKQQEKISSDIAMSSVMSQYYNALRNQSMAQQGLINAQIQTENSARVGQNISNQLENQFAGVARRHPYFYGMHRLGILNSMSNAFDTAINSASRLYKFGSQKK